MYEVALTYAVIAGFMSVLLMLYAVEKKNDHFFLFSLLFLIISWGGIEWASWLQGYNLFELVFTPVVPLASYFVGWGVFIIYVSEKYFKRRYWVVALVVVAFFIWISTFCMNCLLD